MTESVFTVDGADYGTLMTQPAISPGGTMTNDRAEAAGAPPEVLRRRLELRRSNAARPHRNRHRDARKGVGKGGRSGGRRASIEHG